MAILLLIYEPYHIHSDESNPAVTDSVVRKEQYAARLKELDMHILSSCEHRNRGDIWNLNDICDQYRHDFSYDLRWRYVAEAYMVKNRLEHDRTNCHIILAARDQEGMYELNEALSEANISGYYYRPRVDMELLMRLSPRHVFVTTACVAGIWRYEDSERILRELHAHFGSSLMLEVQYHHTPSQVELNRHILSLYRRYRIPLIMGTDSHYVYPEQASERNWRLEANGIHYEDEDGWFMDLPDAKTAFDRFADQGVLSDAQIQESMENTLIFREFEDIPLPKNKKIPNIHPELTVDERNDLYRGMIRTRFEEESRDFTDAEKQRHLEQIAYEESAVTQTGTADYFIAAHDIVQRGLQNGGVITKTGRGSGVSYVTNYYLGFTSVNRLTIPVTLYPDRFISKERMASGSLPD